MGLSSVSDMGGVIMLGDDYNGCNSITHVYWKLTESSKGLGADVCLENVLLPTGDGDWEGYSGLVSEWEEETDDGACKTYFVNNIIYL